MAVGVFTRERRVSFVNGWETGGTDPADGSVEVGDGTAYPLECTLDQVVEIFHRVKDAWFIQGHAYLGTGDPYIQPEYNEHIYASTTETTHRRYDTTFSDFSQRGYTTVTDYGGIVFVDPTNEQYLGTAYDSGAGVDYRDIADNERGIYVAAILPSWHIINGDVVNAFSWNQEVPTAASDTFFFTAGAAFDLDPPTYVATTSSVIFTGYVAIIKSNPANALTAADNRFFIQAEFKAAGSAASISTNKSSISGTVTELTGGGYTIRLAGDVDVSCPIYADNTGFANVGAVEFIHKAQEWWPYARLNADGAAEPTTAPETGGALASGSGFSSFAGESASFLYLVYF